MSKKWRETPGYTRGEFTITQSPFRIERFTLMRLGQVVGEFATLQGAKHRAAKILWEEKRRFGYYERQRFGLTEQLSLPLGDPNDS